MRRFKSGKVAKSTSKRIRYSASARNAFGIQQLLVRETLGPEAIRNRQVQMAEENKARIEGMFYINPVLI